MHNCRLGGNRIVLGFESFDGIFLSFADRVIITIGGSIIIIHIPTDCGGGTTTPSVDCNVDDDADLHAIHVSAAVRSDIVLLVLVV